MAKKMIPIKDFCAHHGIGIDFIHDLHYNNIIELVMVKRTGYIEEKNLPAAEKAVRLYTDLQINIEGIHTIFQLLSSLEKKNAEIISLRNELLFYTNDIS